MKRKIAIVAGGDSSEFHVSLRSAEGIHSFIDKDKYDLYVVEFEGLRWEVQLPEGKKAPIDRNDFSFTVDGHKTTFDFAYVTIHGTPGEDGLLQGYFDMLHIPYSNCGVLASALTYNKYACNQFLNKFGINIAESIVIHKGEENEIGNKEIVDKIGIPCFVKPSLGGSSFGVSKVNEESELRPAITKAFDESDEIIIESFLDGTEITCGFYKTKQKEVAFPITEVVTKNEFFDYNAKYNGQVKEITPARIDASVAKDVQQLTSKIYRILGAKGIIRVDYILTKEGGNTKINLLEVNTTPGMTATSFIPQQVKAAGMDIKDVMTDIIEDHF